MTRAELIALVTSNIYANNNNEVTAPMVRDSILAVIAFMGDAATYNVGAVEQGGTTLVTGGSVYSAINTALSAAVKFQGVTTTALYDGATTNPITIDGASYTARKGDEVIYGGKEFLWTGTKWQQLGDEESWALKTVTISAGTGLTGGGDLTANRTISLSQDSIDKLALAASAYQLPATGIPKTDLAAAVQTTLGNADTVAGYFTSGILGSTHLPSMYVGRTQVAFSAANATLLGIDAISNAASSGNTDKSRIVWDNTNKAWHFLGSIYADGFVSGGGLSSGGGTGGIDLDAMWASLTTTSDEHGTDKIAAGHIPDMSSVYGYLKSADLSAYATRTWVGENYLPLSAGSSYPLTSSLYVNANTSYALYLRGGSAYSLTRYLDSSGNNVVDTGWINDTRGNLAYIGNLSSGGILSLDVSGCYYSNDSTPKKYTIYHSGNLTKSVLTGLLDASGGYYLPLTGGTLATSTNYPLTIKTSSSNNILRLYSDENQVAAFAWQSGAYGVYMQNAAVSGTPYVNIASDGVFKYNNTNPFYHSGNSNKSDVDWTCSTLSANGDVSIAKADGATLTIANTTYNSNDGNIVFTDRLGNPRNGIKLASVGAASASRQDFVIYSSNNATSPYTPTWSESLRVTYDGKVGIGTSAPSTKLHVAGEITAGVSSGNFYTVYGQSYLTFHTGVYTGGWNAEVGVGGDGTTTGKIAGAYLNGSTVQRYWYGGADYSSAALNILPGGTVGIGTINPSTSYKLHVVGAAIFDGTTTDKIRLQTSGAYCVINYYPTTSYLWSSGANNSGQFYWWNSGANATVSYLTSSGNFITIGAVTGGQASDLRLKTNVASMTDNQALAMIMSLRPVTFTWNQKATELYDQYQGNDLGFIAQEVEVIPGLSKAIGTIFEDYKRLDPVKFIAPMVKVAQNHETRIQQLERELAQVKSENKILRDRLNMS